MVRFAFGLLDRGGQRKSKLRLRTILGYVHAIAVPIARYLGDNPLSQPDEVWQETFRQIIGAVTPSRRARRFHALRRFHWILSQEFSISEIDFGELAGIAGQRISTAEAGMLSKADRSAVASMLTREVSNLVSDGADPEAIHCSMGSRVAFLAMSSTSVRTGEVYGLRLGDVQLGKGARKIFVRGSRYQSLKSAAARRQADLSGHQSALAEGLLKEWIDQATSRLGGALDSSSPLFMSLENPGERIPRDMLFAPIGELIRTVCGDRRGRTYWLRKAGAHEKLSKLMSADHRSLWPARDFIASMGQSSIRVTLASYIHDPVLPFTRFFRSPFVSVISAQRMATAMGQSLTRVVRRRGGSRLRQQDHSSVSERIGAMLGHVLICAESGGFWEFPPPVAITGHPYTVDMGKTDAWLRRVAAGDTVAAASAALRIHSPLQSVLTAQLERLRTEYQLSISSTEPHVTVKLVPPRRIRNDGGIGELVLKPESRDVLAAMCDSWLKLAAMPGVPAGIPGTPSAWQEWEVALPALSAIRWSANRRGALEFRTPSAQGSARRSAWPLFRWMVLLSWISKNLAESRGRTPMLLDGATKNM